MHTCARHYLVVKSALSRDLQYRYIAINVKQYMYEQCLDDAEQCQADCEFLD